ncbi:MAG: aspartate-semialdehyde dehydrogenase [Planctomycetes bacterium]|nr:aspartate-semialdehyde dehydrogenase [Planctomycetota bacterium]
MTVRSRIPVAVLGATGAVGQRFVARLAQHPWFEVAELVASERSAGRRYDAACAWRHSSVPSHGGLGPREVLPLHADRIRSKVVFSALDAAVAAEIEPALAQAGALVFSNASAFRMEEDVPLLVPEVNAEHLALLGVQRRRRGWSGGIVCNPNCTTAVLAMALAPLEARFGIARAFVATMQAVSGAGYPGVPSLDALGNVIPFIRGEEEKVESELRKLLGRRVGERIEPAALVASAMCHRVPVIDGHSEAVSLELRGAPSLELVRSALESWRGVPQELALPSAPSTPIVLHSSDERPQPRLDVERDGGMSVHVGRLRPCPLFGTKLFLLGNNVERGAAGASVLNAELCHARGLLPA